MDLLVGLGSTYKAHDEESKAFVHGLGWNMLLEDDGLDS